MKRVSAIVVFYLVNFGLWELIAPIVTGEWASFIVYVILFLFIVLLYKKELIQEWKIFQSNQLKDKKFLLELVILLAVYFLLTVGLLLVINKFNLDILPQNNDNVKEQMAAVPIVLAIIQGCFFAPVIEEMVFRYSIVEKENRKVPLFILCVLSVILFDCIHIVRLQEFFYYFLPAIVLLFFYVRKGKNPFASMLMHSIINAVGYISLLAGIL